MKILIIGFTKIKYMPYMNFYIENIDRDSNEVHVLYWNRDCHAEHPEEHYPNIVFHEYAKYQEDDVAKYKKVSHFIGWRNYATRVIQNEGFDFIVVLHTLPGVLLHSLLKKQYDKKYILDYRDSTYEENAAFRKMIHSLVHHAKMTFVSSDGFRKYLPSDALIYTSHNILTDSLDHRQIKVRDNVPSNKIRVAFWGFIRHEDINKALIRNFKGDQRFELHYYGREQAVALALKGYADELKAHNVFFHGEYSPEERYDFVRKTDIIHNIYYDNNTMLAMGNKYYDGITFYLPQICMAGSYMGKCCEKNGVGYMSNPYDENFMENIYQYYQHLDKKKFYAQCDNALMQVLQEYEMGKKAVKSCFN